LYCNKWHIKFPKFSRLKFSRTTPSTGEEKGQKERDTKKGEREAGGGKGGMLGSDRPWEYLYKWEQRK